MWSQLSGPKLPTTHPGCPCPAAPSPGPLPPRGRTATPGPQPRAPDSPPGRAPRKERAEAGAGRCGLGICARRPLCPPPPGGGSGGAAAVTRRPRGGKARPLPAPPAAALPPPGTKETKPRRPGRASLLPPAPAGPPSPRPPPRPGRKQPGEPGARPRVARDPAFQPCGLRTCRGRGTRPLPVGRWLLRGGSHGNAGRGQASPGRGAEPRALAARPDPTPPHPIPPPLGLTCALRRNRNQESSRDGRDRGGGVRSAPTGVTGTAPGLFLLTGARWDQHPSPAPPARQPPPLLRSAPNSLLPFLWSSFSNFLYLNFQAPGFSPPPYSQDSLTVTPSFRPPPLCQRSIGFGVGPGFVPPLSQVT